ncbi:MAG: baseplate J/gp47 family protein [Alphaproteobacteria bacterium]|nr:baseplate J/gp47 family protein [Alphaproteobacteria bacterium]
MSREAPREISYLAKDYDSFRRLLMQHLKDRAPGWDDDLPADALTTLVEVLAYAGDQLSYYQDAVATEAYLNTARLRSSVRRHARLLGTRLGEGCAARVFVQLLPLGEGPVTVPAGTLLQAGASHARREPGRPLPGGAIGFELMFDVTLHPAHGELPLADDLPAGATAARLAGAFPALEAGDVLIFQRQDPTGVARAAVRLSEVTVTGGATEVRWRPEDALRERFPNDAGRSVALGNIALADHGVTRRLSLPEVSPWRRYRPSLPMGPVCFRAPLSPDEARALPASATLVGDPARALPAVSLRGGVGADGAPIRWSPVEGLELRDGTEPVFVVEQEADGSASLLFGSGQTGSSPEAGQSFEATAREGGGRRGNIGRDTEFILHGPEGGRIERAWAPLAAAGGVDPETAEAGRLRAARSVMQRRGLLTAADYKARAQSLAGVRAAQVQVTTRSTQPPTRVFSLQLDPADSSADGPTLVAHVTAALEAERAMGQALEVTVAERDAVFVSLTVTTRRSGQDDRVRRAVQRALLGQGGLLAELRLGFGEALPVSRVVAAVQALPEVERVLLAELRAGSSAAAPSERLTPTAADRLLDLQRATLDVQLQARST